MLNPGVAEPQGPDPGLGSGETGFHTGNQLGFWFMVHCPLPGMFGQLSTWPTALRTESGGADRKERKPAEVRV